MRTSLVIAILAMGLLTMALALVSGGIYRNLAVDNQSAALAEILALQVNSLFEEQGKKSQGLVLRMQAESNLSAMIAGRQPKEVSVWLDRQFLSDPVTSGDIRLEKLLVFDRELMLLAYSSKGMQDVEGIISMCRGLIARANRIGRGQRRKLLTDSCLIGSTLYHAALIPLGAEPHGYIMVVSNPLASLIALESKLHAPVRISLPGGALIYESGNWDEVENMGTTVSASHVVHAQSSKQMLHVSALKNINAFYNKLSKTQYTVLLIAAVVTIQAVFIALFVLQRIAINPLQALAAQLRKVRQDKDYLGQRVPVSGNIELSELGEGFNAMTTRLKELYGSLEQLAFTDPLTGLPNRSLFHDRLEQTILTARRENKPFALFIMDLDRFKDINDSLGHHIGDLILEQVGKRLKTKLRESDTVARMGGDEFAVLLPSVSGDYSAMAARMLLKALRVPFEIDDQTFDIGASIGIALYPDHGEDATALIQHADVAMYAAKNANSGLSFYTPGLSQDNAERLALMTELRQALEQDQFVLYYQPKIDLHTGRFHGVEALVRWNHPNDDLMLPDTFIPLLEQTGLIRSLTPWVLAETLDFQKKCHYEGLDFKVSINLSVRDLQDPYFADTLEEMLLAKETPPSILEMEITESAVMTDPARVMEVLTRLDQIGVERSIDDFGTGYSSLSYLKKLPVNRIKIDKSFVVNMVHDENDATIVRSSIDLAHNMGLKVVAEGVETEDTLKLLEQLGCDYVQGYVISPPLAADALKEWLRESPWGLKRPGVRGFHAGRQ